MIVHANKTPIAPEDVAHALRAAWLKLFEAEPTDLQLAVLMAQSALETGRWKSCWNYNLGNMKPGSKWKGDICQFRLNEVIKNPKTGKLETKWFDPPHPQTNMRAYDSLVAAAEDYLGILRRRFDRSWPYVLSGDPVGFSQALKKQGYYTADEPPYTKALKSLHKEFMAVLLADPDETPVTLPPEDHGLETLALTIAAQEAVDEVIDQARKDMLDD